MPVEFRLNKQLIRFSVDIPFYPEKLQIHDIAAQNAEAAIRAYLVAPTKIRYIRFLGLSEIRINNAEFLLNFTVDFISPIAEEFRWLAKTDLGPEEARILREWIISLQPEVIGTARYLARQEIIKIHLHVEEFCREIRSKIEMVEWLLAEPMSAEK